MKQVFDKVKTIEDAKKLMTSLNLDWAQCHFIGCSSHYVFLDKNYNNIASYGEECLIIQL